MTEFLQPEPVGPTMSDTAIGMFVKAGVANAAGTKALIEDSHPWWRIANSFKFCNVPIRDDHADALGLARGAHRSFALARIERAIARAGINPPLRSWDDKTPPSGGL